MGLAQPPRCSPAICKSIESYVVAQPAICLAQPAIWWPPGLYCHLLGLGIGVLSISHFPISIFPFPFPIPNSHLQFPSPVPNPSPQSQAQAQSQSLDNLLHVGSIVHKYKVKGTIHRSTQLRITALLRNVVVMLITKYKNLINCVTNNQSIISFDHTSTSLLLFG